MNHSVTFFKEHKEFRKNRPWDVVEMRFETAATTPPHYADTIEILICHRLSGTACVGGSRYELQGDMVLFIAPNVIHSVYYSPNPGNVLVVKLHPEELKPLIDLEKILKEMGRDFSVFSGLIPNYEEILEQAEILRRSERISMDAMAAVVRIFQLLLNCEPTEADPRKSAGTGDEELCRIISWTEAHFAEKITLDAVAEEIGYNKHYFCTKFKQATGETYLQYLNNLRISQACKLLKSGFPISQVCEACGFDNPSYFIQLFRRTTGITPKQYVLHAARNEF